MIKQTDHELLIPCPFCKNENRLTRKSYDYTDQWGQKEVRFYIQCSRCGATGPDSETHEEAIENWNRANSNAKDIFWLDLHGGLLDN